MIRPLKVFPILLVIVAASYSQSSAPKLDLYKEYCSTTTPLFTVQIPGQTCRKIITQADKLVSDNKLRGIGSARDLQTATNNLRVCATTESLERPERDLAVGLYGEFLLERDWREHE